jgi:hypothetical protein
MKRLSRAVCLVAALVVGGIDSPAYGQHISVSSISTSPNPFSTVRTSISVSL